MRYFSRIASTILYILDIVTGCVIFGSILGGVITAIVIPLTMLIQIRLTLYTSGAERLVNYPTMEANRVYASYKLVEARAISSGFKFKEPTLYICPDETYNAYSCGNAIVIHEPLVYDVSLEGVIAHEFSHYLDRDSIFFGLLNLNILAISLVVMLLSQLYVVCVVILVTLTFCIVFDGGVGYVLGTFIGRIIQKLATVLCNLFVMVSQAVSSLFSRWIEYKSDRTATDLGYGNELIAFLESNPSNRKPLSLEERLLSTHPPDKKRVARIELRLQEILAEEYQSLPSDY